MLLAHFVTLAKAINMLVVYRPIAGAHRAGYPFECGLARRIAS